jgi:hypothetical protein
MMKRIVEIVPARPGWYARWRAAGESTRCHPVAVWVLVESDDRASREVVGVDTLGQWPGSDDNEPGAEFVRYLFHPPASGHPADAVRDQAVRAPGS